ASSHRRRRDRPRHLSPGRLYLVSRQGLAAGLGGRAVLVSEGLVPVAGLQHASALQCRTEHAPLRDAGLAVCPGQAPRHQWMVDGTGPHGEEGLAGAGRDRRRRSADRDLLNESARRYAHHLTEPSGAPPWIGRRTLIEPLEDRTGRPDKADPTFWANSLRD